MLKKGLSNIKIKNFGTEIIKFHVVFHKEQTQITRPKTEKDKVETPMKIT